MNREEEIKYLEEEIERRRNDIEQSKEEIEHLQEQLIEAKATCSFKESGLFFAKQTAKYSISWNRMLGTINNDEYELDTSEETTCQLLLIRIFSKTAGRVEFADRHCGLYSDGGPISIEWYNNAVEAVADYKTWWEEIEEQLEEQ